MKILTIVSTANHQEWASTEGGWNQGIISKGKRWNRKKGIKFRKEEVSEEMELPGMILFLLIVYENSYYRFIC